MKIHITNAKSEPRYAILKARNWTTCYSGYCYNLPMEDVCVYDTKFVIGCATNDDYGKMWYDEIYKVATENKGLVFYADGEPTVDIAIKIIRIVEKDDEMGNSSSNN